VRRVLAAAAALALVACAPAPAAQRVAGPSDRCGEVETVPIQGGAHLLGDQPPPVPYTSVPPTSGWHRSGEPAGEVHGSGDPLPEPAQVAVLEAGAVVVTYRGLAPDERGRLEQVAQLDHPGRVTVTPYDRLAEGEVAFTAWGTLQRCRGLDTEALAAFVATYAAPGGATPAAH